MHILGKLECLLTGLPGCDVAWDDHSDPGPLLVVPGVVDSGFSELPAAALTHTCPRCSRVAALPHQGPGATCVVGVLQQDGGRGAELRLTADVQLVGAKHRLWMCTFKTASLESSFYSLFFTLNCRV